MLILLSKRMLCRDKQKKKKEDKIVLQSTHTHTHKYTHIQQVRRKKNRRSSFIIL
jgi:hypothetical protein